MPLRKPPPRAPKSQPVRQPPISPSRQVPQAPDFSKSPSDPGRYTRTTQKTRENP
jgi:hypothetical protein